MRIKALSIAALLTAGVAHGAGTLAITNVNVIDVEDGRSRYAQTVLIEGDRIVDVGESSRARVPAGATVVDGNGRFLLPGFWDMHVHSHREQRSTYHYPLFVEAGLSPLEALQAATLRPLQYAGRARAGRAIAAGEIADLVLLDADPRTSIDSTRSIRAVSLRGQLFDRDALDALLAQGRAAARRNGSHQ